jgi:tRNA nucleotidyltransferase (CCA-adding enzyme)
MHMLPRPSQAPIVTGGRPAGEVAQELWQRLLAEPWPLPLGALPADTALVGGAVRDGLLGRLASKPDLDLVVPGDAIALTRQLARSHGGSCVVLDPDHDIARLVVRGWTIDLARRDGDSLEADLGRRDYTVNAIALPLNAASHSDTQADTQAQVALVDPTGGLGDLQRHQLVAVSEANLLADPLRLLRGIRLACSLDFSLEPTSRAWIERHADRLNSVAGERVLAELEKLAAAVSGEGGLGLALECGLLQGWGADAGAAAALAPLTAAQARQRGLNASESAWALPLARLSALLPPEALLGLRSSRRMQQRCRALRHWRRELDGAGGWAGLAEASSLALHRDLEADLPALLLLTPEPHLPLLERWRNPNDPLLHPRPPLDGRTLQQHLAIPAGPELGRLLDHLTLERAFGRLPCAPGPTATAPALAEAERWWLQQKRSAEQDRRRD